MRISDWSSDVCSSDLVHQRAQALAASMSQLPLAALSLTKRLFNASLNSDMNTMLDLEAAGQGIARSTAYHGAAATRYRSEERRVGQEGVGTCRSRWSPEH